MTNAYRRALSSIEGLSYLLLVVIAVTGSVLEIRDTAAWLLLLLSFPLFLLVPSIRDDAGTRYAIWTVLASHHLLALAFAFGGFSFSVDAESFHSDAVRFASTGKFILGIDFEFYTQVMARLYRWAGFFRLGGASRLLGAQISVFGFAVGLLFFVKLLDGRGSGNLRPISIVLFGLLPSGVVFTSIPMRESFELSLLIVYIFLVFALMKQPRIRILAGVFLVTVVFGLFHKGLILYSVFMSLLVICVCLWMVRKNRMGVPLFLVALLLPIGSAAIVYVISMFDLRNSGVINYFLSGRILENLERSRAFIVSEQPRSAFGTDIDFTSFSRFIVTYAQVYWQYLAGPFLWNAERFGDVVASGEAVVRLTLLVGMVVHVFRRRCDPEFLVLVVLYVTMTMLWALGTTNYGQAIRHHVLTNWILILLGVPSLYEMLAGRVKWRVASDGPD